MENGELKEETKIPNGEQGAGIGMRKRVSVVWRYFEKLDRFRVRCRLCRHVQNYQGTTGNILRHLKNKHAIDATLRGQLDSPGQLEKLNDELSETHQEEDDHKSKDDENLLQPIVKTNEPHLTIESMQTRQQRLSRSKVHSYCEETIDPYADAVIFDDYIGSNSVVKETFVTTSAKAVAAEAKYQNHEPASKSKQNNSIEEERILAEIEYFREKAAYYRMQKNLTALQAKKIKYELDQIG